MELRGAVTYHHLLTLLCPLHCTALAALQELRTLKPWTQYHELSELAIREGDVLPPCLTLLELDADNRSLAGMLGGPLASPCLDPVTALTRLKVCGGLGTLPLEGQTFDWCILVQHTTLDSPGGRACRR